MAQGSIVVVHPGVQHSRELVRALYDGGLLSRFVTSNNGGLSNAAWLPDSVRRRLRTRITEGVPPDMVRTIPWIEVAAMVAAVPLGTRLRRRLYYSSLELFDRLAATRISSDEPQIVIGFENSCRHTFEKAKSIGALCVLDAASVHHASQPEYDGDMGAESIARVRKRKDEEIGLADHFVVLSTYARDSYLSAGVPSEKISIVMPGVHLSSTAQMKPTRPAQGNIRFLFAGNVKHAKGIDLLLEAFSQLDVANKRLEIAGSLTEPSAFPASLPDGVEYLGKLDRRELSEAYARSDVLVLPSRADGFGFVVAEAMGSGLPVIVSSAVGAKDLVTQGVTGWTFESGSADQLRETMAEAFKCREDWASMGLKAQQTIAGLTWGVYSLQIQTLYRRLLGTRDIRNS